MSADWKQLTRSLCEMHNLWGAAALTVKGENPALAGKAYVNLTDDKDLLVVESEELTPKVVRAWLWKLRKQRKVQRSRAVLWSAVDQERRRLPRGAAGFAIG